MIIYLDSDYKCHLTNDGSMRGVETDAFEGMAPEMIKGYRFVPLGEEWVREDGVTFSGLMIAPFQPIRETMVSAAISYLSDAQAEIVSALFPDWEIGAPYAVGDRVQYDALLYKCVQAHTSQADWLPPAAPALWARTSTEEWPEWVQPSGAHDAYSIGSKVSHNGKHWISTADANIWEPGVYGWDEVTE